MNQLNKVLYWGHNLRAAVTEFQINEFQTDTLAIEQCHDQVMHYINLEREVAGDAAMEQLYNNLPEYIIDAIIYADFLTTSLSTQDLIEH